MYGLCGEFFCKRDIKKRGSTRFTANIASRHLPKKHYYLIAYIIQTL